MIVFLTCALIPGSLLPPLVSATGEGVDTIMLDDELIWVCPAASVEVITVMKVDVVGGGVVRGTSVVSSPPLPSLSLDVSEGVGVVAEDEGVVRVVFGGGVVTVVPPVVVGVGLLDVVGVGVDSSLVVGVGVESLEVVGVSDVVSAGGADVVESSAASSLDVVGSAASVEEAAARSGPIEMRSSAPSALTAS